MLPAIHVEKRYSKTREQKNEIVECLDGASWKENEDGCRPKRKRGTESVVLPKECIFCKKEKTKNRKREVLRQCVDDRAEKSIKSASKKIGDYNILSLPDLIAAEAHYHKSCYDHFVRVNRDKENEDSEDPNVEEGSYKEVLKFCLELEYQPDIVPVKNLIDMMKVKLEETDSILKASTRKNLRRKIERDVKSIKFINVGGVLYIYPIGVSQQNSW